MDLWLRKNLRIATARPSALNGLTVQEAVVMAETRALLQHALDTLTVADDLRKLAAAALRQRHRTLAPFMPLGPSQRLGWLDEITSLTCSAPGLDGFTPGASYLLSTRTLLTHQRELRPNSAFPEQTEEVLVSGRDLIATLSDDDRRCHVFAHHMPPTDQIPHRVHCIHSLDRLLAHFLIPEVPDIARLLPARFKQLQQRLSEL